MIKYCGRRTPEGREVWVEENGKKYPLPLRDDLRTHSTEFEWGYMGSGPSQLALAILAHHTRDCDKAQDLYQQYKMDVIAGITADTWEIPAEKIETWLATD